MSPALLVAISGLAGALATLLTAVVLGLVRLRQSTTLVRQSEVNRLQDVIDGLSSNLLFWREQYESLQTRVHTLEQTKIKDAQENSQLQTEIATLKREQQARNDAWEKERKEWTKERNVWATERAELKQQIEVLIAEREELLVRIVNLEHRLTEVSENRCNA